VSEATETKDAIAVGLRVHTLSPMSGAIEGESCPEIFHQAYILSGMAVPLEGDASAEVGNRSVAHVGGAGILTTTIGSAVNPKPRAWAGKGVSTQVKGNKIGNNQNAGWSNRPQVLLPRGDIFRESV